MKFLIAVLSIAILGSVFAEDAPAEDKKNVKRGAFGLAYGGYNNGYDGYGGAHSGNIIGYNDYDSGYSGHGLGYSGYAGHGLGLGLGVGVGSGVGVGLGVGGGYAHGYPTKVYSGYNGVIPHGYNGYNGYNSYNGYNNYNGYNGGYYSGVGSHYPQSYSKVSIGHGYDHSYY